jgi:hypothetical protein
VRLVCAEAGVLLASVEIRLEHWGAEVDVASRCRVGPDGRDARRCWMEPV